MFIPYGDNVERKTFPFLTVFLILINVCVLLHTESLIMNDNEEFEATYAFFDTYGLSPNGLVDGNVPAVISHMFLHNDIMHLVGNMVVLWAMACSLEAVMGRVALIVCYLFWGMIGGFLHVYMDWGSDTPLIGASGAIAGLIGAYTVVFGPFAKLKCLFFFFFRPFVIRVPAMVFGVLYIGMQLLEASNDATMSSNISWFTHIGGFFAGVGTMLIFRGEFKGKIARTADGEVIVDQEGVASAEPLQPAGPVGEDYIAMQIAAAQAEADAAIQGQTNPCCTYCQHSLEHATYLSATLARCENDECQRLNYLETISVPTMAR